jgi:hypothetical protein
MHQIKNYQPMLAEQDTHPSRLTYQQIITADLPPYLEPARDAATITQLPIEDLLQKLNPKCPIDFWDQLAFKKGSEALAQIIAKALNCQCHEVMPTVYSFKQTRAKIEQFQNYFPSLIPPVFSEVLITSNQ